MLFSWWEEIAVNFSCKSSYKSTLIGFSNYDVTTYLYHWPNNQMLFFFHQTYFSIRFLLPRALLAFLTKGQIILKRLFCVFNFFQKMNKNTSHTSKNEFIRSFFGRILRLTIFFDINWPSATIIGHKYSIFKPS